MTEPDPLRVGDLVRVARSCMGNLEGALALVVERYDRAAMRVGSGIGTTLLFPNGAHDGFSPKDLDVFGVTRVRHLPAFAKYRWASSMRLAYEFTNGHFTEAFRE